MGLRKAGRKILSIRSAVSLPPLPWPSTICLCSKMGTGQEPKSGETGASGACCSFVVSGGVAIGLRSASVDRCRMRNGTRYLLQRVRALRLKVAAVGVVRSARALGGDHGCAEGMLRIAERAEGRAIVRLLDAAQDFAADAYLRLECGDLGDVEEFLRVVRSKLLAQTVPAARNGADAAPLAVAHLKDLADQLLRRQIAGLVEHARVLVLDDRAPLLELLDCHQRGFQDFQRLEAGDHNGRLVARADGNVPPVPHPSE